MEFVPPQVSSFDLIRKCRAISVITGTAGWEGFALGKPVIAFGDVFFRHFPNVLGMEICPTMGIAIQEYIDGFHPDEESIRDAVSAYFACTQESTMVDVGEDTRLEDAHEESRNFAAACEWAVAQLNLESDMAKSDLEREGVSS